MKAVADRDRPNRVSERLQFGRELSDPVLAGAKRGPDEQGGPGMHDVAAVQGRGLANPTQRPL